uniref:(northern house mosquito) hypothetical protein n=1 Tax=Culex pipiens TaxID=7175 RepID=A0A8D8LDZ6_CULPI
MTTAGNGSGGRVPTRAMAVARAAGARSSTRRTLRCWCVARSRSITGRIRSATKTTCGRFRGSSAPRSIRRRPRSTSSTAAGPGTDWCGCGARSCTASIRMRDPITMAPPKTTNRIAQHRPVFCALFYSRI